MADVDAMLGACGTGQRAVVVGGGLLGLEAANGLMSRGMTVTVVHLMPTVMERQLDRIGWLPPQARAGEPRPRRAHGGEHGAIVGDGKVEAVRLKDGQGIPADIVVMAVGIRPNADLAQAAGLAVERGVIVDDRMVTSDPDILAVGECVSTAATYGLVAPLYEMAKVAADTLARRKASTSPPSQARS